MRRGELHKRIPPHVRELAEKAGLGLGEVDWYAGPLLPSQFSDIPEAEYKELVAVAKRHKRCS